MTCPLPLGVVANRAGFCEHLILLTHSSSLDRVLADLTIAATWQKRSTTSILCTDNLYSGIGVHIVPTQVFPVAYCNLAHRGTMTRVYKSLYGAVPPLATPNVHYIFNSPESHSMDYLLHIDGLTGAQRTKKQFWERVEDAATALSISAPEGGPGIGLATEKEEIVGILSQNCLVRA